MELNTSGVSNFPVTKSLLWSSVNNLVISSIKYNAISNYPALKLKYVGKRVREHRVPPLKAVGGCAFSSDDIVVKSPHDRRLYRYVELQNGLCALLVHDPRICEKQQDYEDDEDDDDEDEDEDEEDDEDEDDEDDEDEDDEDVFKKATAAMCVGMGQCDDPLEAQGLAHFLEHMLFLGTEEFPIEDEFKSYLSKHGGSGFGTSYREYTCYYFEVKNDFLKGALTRFSQMFISPLMEAETMEREVRAVDSEFHRSLPEDWARLEQLQCHTCLPNHPLNRFIWGNKKSLVVEPMEKGVDLREQILTLFHENHHAGSMKLVVIGGETLDVLETCVLELFSNIKKGPQAKPKASLAIPIWESGKLFKLQAVKDHHILVLSWTLPSLRKDYMKKAEDYLAHLFKHQGRGSLHYFLKGRGLVTRISAGVDDDGFTRSSFAYVFGMTIYLTESGLEKMYEIIGFVYEYIKLLHQEPPQEWIYKELQCDANSSFENPKDIYQKPYAAKLAENLFVYPPEHVIYGDYAYEWDPQMINHMLAYFRPDNMRIDVMSKSFDTLENLQHEPWFESQYVEDSIPSSFLDLWKDPPEIDASLHLPAKNEISPLDLFIYGDRSPCSILDRSSPRCMINEPLVALRYKLDKEIEHPRASTYFRITQKGEYYSLKNAMLTKLFVLLLKDELDDIVYQASNSKLETSISLYKDKLELDEFDSNDELTILLFKILEVLKTYVPKADRFQVIKEDLERTLRNTNMVPSDHSEYLKLQVLYQSFWDVEDKLSLLKDLNLADLSSFIPELRSQIYIKGNLLGKNALSMSDIFKSNSSIQPQQFKMRSHSEFVMCLPPGTDLVRDVRVKNKLDPNSVTEIYFQIGPEDETDFMKQYDIVYLFWTIIKHPFYNQLRTKEQLGYVVDCVPEVIYDILGFSFCVESSDYDPAYLQERIINFVNSLDVMLQGFDDEIFENEDGIEKKDVIEWYRTYLQKPSPQRRTLAIRLWGCNTDGKELTVVESESSTQVIDDLQTFKKSSQFYPTNDY